MKLELTINVPEETSPEALRGTLMGYFPKFQILTIKVYRTKVRCPVCGEYIYERTRKNHLKSKHGYRYTSESPSEPVAPND